MPNPNPVMSPKFIAARTPQKYPDDPLSDKAIAIRFKTSVDKKLRAIPEYSGLVRDCVDKYFDDLANPHAGKSLSSTDEPINLADYGSLADKVSFVRLPQKVEEAWRQLGAQQRADVLRVGAIREMKRRGML